jgi:hypothetical protein
MTALFYAISCNNCNIDIPIALIERCANLGVRRNVSHVLTIHTQLYILFLIFVIEGRSKANGQFQI